jgi:HPt (histidine-containing phosphotransfer) domain-containing protein
MTEAPTATIDRDLSDLVPDFLARKRAELAGLIALARRGEFEAVARMAHKLAGQGASFGFDKITEAGRAMERATRAHESGQIIATAEELLTYLNSVRIVYSESST